MDNGTIRSLSLSRAKKKVIVAKQVAITATMTRRERCHAKKREQERAIRVPGKREYQNLVESRENSVPSFLFTPLNFVM
jgi:hypothetical protein